MPSSAPMALGSVVALWRYPVKSMMGEALNVSEGTEHGLVGDRAYALIDVADGKVASAKNPRKWPRLFEYRADLVESTGARERASSVRITLPDGTVVSSEQADVNRILSRSLARDVTLAATESRLHATVGAAAGEPQPTVAEEYWPDIDGLDYRDTVTEFGLPDGTFFDAASVHVLTTATLERLRELYPQGRFEARRFRPNIVVQMANADVGFPENDWVGHTLAIGQTVRLHISGPCPRCVMTTLPQDDLPKDAGILRTAAQYNHASVGAYASVLRGGTVRRGDSVTLA